MPTKSRKSAGCEIAPRISERPVPRPRSPAPQRWPCRNVAPRPGGGGVQVPEHLARQGHLPRICRTTTSTRVNEMAGGRLKLELLPAGAVAKAFEVQDAVHRRHARRRPWRVRLLVRQAQGLFAVRHAARLGLARQPDDRLDEVWRRPGALRRTGAAGPRPQSRRLPYRPDADPAARLVQAGRSTDAGSNSRA